MSDSKPKEKILESSPMNGLAIPVAIVLVGALIVFGVTKMLSTDRSHRDLISEMHSKTFGNRWVAAYELSKLFASKSIPHEDIPWVIENLESIYKNSQDARSRNFIVLAIGSLNNPLAIKALNKALDDADPKVQFNAIVSLGNMDSHSMIDWAKVSTFLDSTDAGLQQVSLYALSNHRISGSDEKIVKFLKHENATLRYAAAIALINFKRNENAQVLKEIFDLGYENIENQQERKKNLNGAEVEALKLSALTALQKNNWKQYNDLLAKVANEDANVKISTKANEVLNMLKN
jgi:HEAT repeat protein